MTFVADDMVQGRRAGTPLNREEPILGIFAVERDLRLADAGRVDGYERMMHLHGVLSR
jgi:hypothetical protein